MRLLEDAEEFVTTRQLRATFNSVALARPIDIIADALRRNVTCKCSIGAPQDRRRYQSRISWLLEQLPEGSVCDTMVHIAWDDGQKTCVDSAVWAFCDSIARHLRAWQPRAVKPAEEQFESAQEGDLSEDRVVVREANIPGGKVRVFDDGSIEHETASGTNWYRSFTELERSLRAKDSLGTRQEPVSADHVDVNGRGEGVTPGPASSTEAEPTSPNEP